MRLTPIREVVERPAPFVTVQAEVGHPAEDARQQLDARWTSIRHRLEHEDVPAALVEEIGERLHEPPAAPGQVRRTIVAADGQIVFDDVQAGAVPWPETTDVGLLPDLAGWLAQADRQVSFGLVVADREGADISFHRGLAATREDRTQVHGQDFQITKVPEGDWAQLQYQRSAENAWKRNAEEVADSVRSGIKRHRPDVVVLAGDDRARHLVEEALEGAQVPLVHVEAGGRAAGSSEEALQGAVRRVLADLEARRDQEIAARLLEASGQGAGAARGLDEVLDAFVQGQVERLVLDLEAARELTVDPAEHPGLPLPEGTTGALPADRVLVAAAAATQAELSLLPRELTKGTGVAALLRWDESA